MKITFKSNAKPVKKTPYSLNPKYKEKVCLKFDNILIVGITESVEEADWVILMAV